MPTKTFCLSVWAPLTPRVVEQSCPYVLMWLHVVEVAHSDAGTERPE